MAVLMINAVAHLLVDGVCAATLLGRLSDAPSAYGLILLYNTLAFSTQGFVGLAADRLRRHATGGCAAMLMVAAGFWLPLDPWVRVAVIGLGNSAFHVAGGVMTLSESGGRADRLGVFVAPGAVGLTLGTLWPGLGHALAAGLVICAAALALCHGRTVSAAPARSEGSDEAAIPVIALLTLSVAVRAVGGTAVNFPWNTGSLTALLLTLSVFAGKCAGGFVCDGLGVRRTAWASILPAALLTAFGTRWLAPSLLGQYALNLTMPVTLWLLYRAMPNSPGFAFGLAASALWPGTLAGRLMKLTGPALWLCVIVSFAFGLAAILYADKAIHDRHSGGVSQ